MTALRLLFVSNLFPPYVRGGYEQLCEEVALGLQQRGHTLSVLTSTAPEGTAPAETHPFPVDRLLRREVEGGLGETVKRLAGGWPALEAANLAHTAGVIADFQPDAVLIWGMWSMPRSVAQRVEQLMGNQVGYYICDYWPSLPSAFVQRLEEPARRTLAQPAKAALRRVFLPQLLRARPAPLAFRHPYCVSKGLRRLLVARGVPISHAEVIYNGIDAAELAAPVARPPAPDGRLRLLYLGRLEATKGVHTLIEGVGLAAQATPLSLSIYGMGDADYEAQLRAAVADGSLEERIFFRGMVPRSQVREVLAEHDVLVFPSEWEEPLARVIQEALAAGLAVIGTQTGGTPELLVEGETGLTYPAGNAAALSRQIRRMAEEPALRARLATRGQARVLGHFTIARMLDEMEAALRKIAADVGLSSPAAGVKMQRVALS